MRKFMSITLSLFIVLSFSACGKKEEKPVEKKQYKQRISQVYAGGKAGRKRIADYDSSGNIIKEADTADDGSVLFCTDYTYGPDGNLLEKTDNVSVTQYEYDKDGIHYMDIFIYTDSVVRGK